MNATTLEKMRKMKFFGMFRTFKTNLESGKQEDYTADEMIANLIEAEWDHLGFWHDAHHLWCGVCDAAVGL